MTYTEKKIIPPLILVLRRDYFDNTVPVGIAFDFKIVNITEN